MTASLLGIIAQHQVLSAPGPTVVQPYRLGKPKATSWSGGSSVTATLPQTPTAGNTLIALVGGNGFASFTPTVSTPAGWTAGPTYANPAGSTRLGLWMFWKLATGSETNPVFNVISNGASNGGVVITEWAGLDNSAPHLHDSSGAQAATTTAGSYTLTDAITTTVTNEWVISMIVEAAQLDSLSGVAWTAPQVSFDAPTRSTSQVQINGGCLAWGSGCYLSAGAKAPQASFTVTASGLQAGIASMSFKVAAGSRPQVVESVAAENITANTSWSATLATTPDPADTLIAAIAHNDTLGSASISGCGATWTAKEVHDTAGGYDMTVWTGVNPTSGGAVTLTSTNARTGVLKVLRVSGTGPAVATSYNKNSGANSTGPVVSAGPGQVVVALQAASGNSTSDYPITSASPALNNWSTDALSNAANGSGSMQDGWLAPSSPGTSCSVTGTSASSRTWPTVMVTCG